jgi:hypothetical protein
MGSSRKINSKKTIGYIPLCTGEKLRCAKFPINGEVPEHVSFRIYQVLSPFERISLFMISHLLGHYSYDCLFFGEILKGFMLKKIALGLLPTGTITGTLARITPKQR